MAPSNPIRWSGPALIAGGILWMVARFCVAFDPPPLGYDGYNRLFSLPLLLVLAGWAGLLARCWRRLDPLARGGWAVALVGLTVMLAGNVVEFWGVLLQDKPNVQAAVSSGEEAWAGSDIGWMVFGLGHLLVVISMALLGIAAPRRAILPRWRGLPLAIAVLGLLWPVLSFTAVGDFAVMAATGAAWARLGHAVRLPIAAAPAGARPAVGRHSP
jgi:hypothetical protein